MNSSQSSKRKTHLVKNSCKFKIDNPQAPDNPIQILIEYVPERGNVFDVLTLPEILKTIGTEDNLCQSLYYELQKRLMTANMKITVDVKIDPATSQKTITECKSKQTRGEKSIEEDEEPREKQKRRKRDRDEGAPRKHKVKREPRVEEVEAEAEDEEEEGAQEGEGVDDPSE